MSATNTYSMHIVKPETLSSQISKVILSEIQSGQFAVGDRLLPEAELAQKYGVSRTVLREAIASLKNEDILESKPGRGIIVKNTRSQQAFRFSDIFETISIDEANHFYEMRAILESEAAVLAASRHTQEEMDKISNAFIAMQDAVMKNQNGNAEHELFNRSIAEASHNPLLIEFLKFLDAKLHDLALKLSINTMASPGRAYIVLEEHRQILKSITAHNKVDSHKAVLTHLNNDAIRAGLEIFDRKV
ncbi:MAG: FCD domain-containing protein [Synergistes sp.]|nr:FCD domain-containing protein [Synergistes sp.]